jgi:hypothetical protein
LKIILAAPLQMKIVCTIISGSSSTMRRRSNEAVLWGGFSLFRASSPNTLHILFVTFFADVAAQLYMPSMAEYSYHDQPE